MSVKIWFLAVLLLTGCSSQKKEKDFQEALQESPDSAPQVEVEAPKPLLDKFEVEEAVEPPKKETPVTIKKKATTKKPSPVPVTKAPAKAPEKTAPTLTQAPPINKLPADYPVGLVTLNAKAEKTWKSYQPNHMIGEKIILDIHYLGMTVGKIMVTNNGKKMINGKEVWHFHSRFKSAPFYSNIYELDDTVDTYVTTDQFLSIRYSLIQRESKQDVDDLQLHDRDQMKTFWFYKQKKSDGSIKNKEKNGFIPFYSIDPFSILFFYQGLPLKDGDAFEIPVINKSKILVLKSQVEGREVIETEKGKQRAIRVHATTQYTGETLKSGDLYFWFSDDSRRILLKAQAKIKIGSVTADIVKN
jgi:hypothetical protein